MQLGDLEPTTVVPKQSLVTLPNLETIGFGARDPILLDLPDDVLLRLLRFLSPPSLLALMRTCTKLFHLYGGKFSFQVVSVTRSWGWNAIIQCADHASRGLGGHVDLNQYMHGINAIRGISFDWNLIPSVFSIPRTAEMQPYIHGHASCVVGNYLVVYGGESRGVFMNRLWLFDHRTMKWKVPKVIGEHLPALCGATLHFLPTTALPSTIFKGHLPFLDESGPFRALLFGGYEQFEGDIALASYDVYVLEIDELGECVVCSKPHLSGRGPSAHLAVELSCSLVPQSFIKDDGLSSLVLVVCYAPVERHICFVWNEFLREWRDMSRLPPGMESYQDLDANCFVLNIDTWTWSAYEARPKRELSEKWECCIPGESGLETILNIATLSQMAKINREATFLVMAGSCRPLNRLILNSVTGGSALMIEDWVKGLNSCKSDVARDVMHLQTWMRLTPKGSPLKPSSSGVVRAHSESREKTTLWEVDAAKGSCNLVDVPALWAHKRPSCLEVIRSESVERCVAAFPTCTALLPSISYVVPMNVGWVRQARLLPSTIVDLYKSGQLWRFFHPRLYPDRSKDADLLTRFLSFLDGAFYVDPLLTWIFPISTARPYTKLLGADLFASVMFEVADRSITRQDHFQRPGLVKVVSLARISTMMLRAGCLTYFFTKTDKSTSFVFFGANIFLCCFGKLGWHTLEPFLRGLRLH
eukprot:Rmarinus@m.9503